MILSCGKQTPKSLPPSQTNQTIRIGLAGSPDRINPILSKTAYASQIHSKVFLPLLTLHPEELKLTSCLAQLVAEENDSLTGKTHYDFEIHPKAVWDNGKPVTVKDYLFTLKLIYNPWISAGAYRNYLSKIHSITPSTNDLKKFRVSSLTDPLHGKLAVSNFEIYPAYFYDPNNQLEAYSFEQLKKGKDELDAADQKTLQAFAEQFQSSKYSVDKDFISGCGPYFIQEWIPDQRLSLQKKQAWWGDSLSQKFPPLLAKPQTLLYKIVPDRFAAVSLLKNQELDVLSNIPPSDFKKLQEDSFMSNIFQFFSPEVFQYYFLAINNEVIAEKNIRQALACLFDVEKNIQDLAYNSGKAIIGPYTKASPIIMIL